MVTESENMTSGLEPIVPYLPCPHCGTNQALDRNTYAFYEGNIRCFYCKGLYRASFGDRYVKTALGSQELVTNGRGETLLSVQPLGDPELLNGLASPPMPKDLYSEFQDAVASLATAPARSTAVLCREIVQHALLMKGIPDESPTKMVHIANSKQPPLLSPMATKQCEAAIFMGDKGGHPQFYWLDKVTPNDAKQAILVTHKVLTELFMGGFV